MAFLLVGLLFVTASVIIFIKCGVKHPYSKGVALAIALSVTATVCLSQNYTHSLIPGADDGIGISNRVAWWLIGEDLWSTERFRASFNSSLFLTLFLIAAYPAVLASEAAISKRRRKH